MQLKKNGVTAVFSLVFIGVRLRLCAGKSSRLPHRILCGFSSGGSIERLEPNYTEKPGSVR